MFALHCPLLSCHPLPWALPDLRSGGVSLIFRIVTQYNGTMEIRIASGRTVDVQAGESLYKALKRNGVYLVASCGGKGACGKCRVRVIEGKTRSESAGKLTRQEVGENLTLACKTHPEGDVVIEIPEESRLVIGDKIAGTKTMHLLEHILQADSRLSPLVRSVVLQIAPPSIEDNISDLERIRKALLGMELDGVVFSHDFVANLAGTARSAEWAVSLSYSENLRAVTLFPAAERKTFGCAVDIGTTTVVVYLIDLADGRLVDAGMTYNSQMRFGDDVITRIVYATEGEGLQDLRNSVVNDINDLIQTISDKEGIPRDDIEAAVISGNTTMAHLFWGLDPASIREEPYVPTVNVFPEWDARTARLKVNPRAPLYTVPCVASYVGGDIVAGVMASGMHRNPEVALFMDIGTNGEIAIGNNEWLITAACSAGPCFEGSGIRHGMRATEGAIEAVSILPDGTAELSVIGNVKPRGVCGSGMIDAICELFLAGLVDQRGRFARDRKTDRIRAGEEGPEFVLSLGEMRDIVLTEVDIENILRAKAAIYAGVSVLLKEVGLTLDIVERIYIAGGFGNYLDIGKAVLIGMLPDFRREKFVFLGNTSIAGAYLCLLSGGMRREAEEIAQRMTYVELSASRNFMDEYMSALFLPHTDIDLFPTVRERLARRRQGSP